MFYRHGDGDAGNQWAYSAETIRQRFVSGKMFYLHDLVDWLNKNSNWALLGHPVGLVFVLASWTLL